MPGFIKSDANSTVGPALEFPGLKLMSHDIFAKKFSSGLKQTTPESFEVENRPGFHSFSSILLK